MLKYSALHNYDDLCPRYNSVLGSVLSDNVTISYTLSGLLAQCSSNRFIQRHILIVLHVSSTLVVGSPAFGLAALPTLPMCFSSFHRSV